MHLYVRDHVIVNKWNIDWVNTWRYKHYISGDKESNASNHGLITEFSGNADDWEAYIEQLESYFMANDITTAAKKQMIT